MTDTQKQFILQFFDNGLIKFGEFKVKLHDQNPDAPLSPVYLDFRLLRRFPETKKLAIEIYKELIKDLTYDLYADIPMAVTPLAATLSDETGIASIAPRGAKKHGSGSKIDGFMPTDKGKTAVLLDDLVTHADSKIEAAKVLEEAGVIVKDIVVIIDREQGGREQLAAMGYTLHTAFTLSDMLSTYLESKRIDQEKYDFIKNRLKELAEFLAQAK